MKGHLLIFLFFHAPCNVFSLIHFLRSVKEFVGPNEDSDQNRNVSELISSKGYPIEDHEVHTEDGYILSVQRIPYGKSQSSSPGPRKPVLVVHGVVLSAADFVINSETQSLGFMLADAGYDVWLGNVRGNTYSKKHEYLSSNFKKFWDFSFDEMGKYDLPAFIDYILEKTKEDQLMYIGFSQGGAMAFILLSEKPEYNDKIKVMVGIAPVSTMGNCTSAMRVLAPIAVQLKETQDLLGAYQFTPSDGLVNLLSRLFCNLPVTEAICANIVFLISGTDMKQLNRSRLHVYLAHTPAGTSTQNMIHFAQLVEYDKFQKQDFGQLRNFRTYGGFSPPEYNFNKIKIPIALFWGENDRIVAPKDVAKLRQKIRKNLVFTKFVKNFTHLDFLWGIEANRYVYDDVIRVLQNYTN